MNYIFIRKGDRYRSIHKGKGIYPDRSVHGMTLPVEILTNCNVVKESSAYTFVKGNRIDMHPCSEDQVISFIKTADCPVQEVRSIGTEDKRIYIVFYAPDEVDIVYTSEREVVKNKSFILNSYLQNKLFSISTLEGALTSLSSLKMAENLSISDAISAALRFNQSLDGLVLIENKYLITDGAVICRLNMTLCYINYELVVKEISNIGAIKVPITKEDIISYRENILGGNKLEDSCVDASVGRRESFTG